MSIVFTTQGTDWDSPMDPRFGRTQFFFVFDEDTGNFKTVDNSAAGQEAHGAGPRTAQKLAELGATALITGNGPGGNAASVLKTIGIEVYIGAGKMTVKEALEAYQNDKLEKFKGV